MNLGESDVPASSIELVFDRFLDFEALVGLEDSVVHEEAKFLESSFVPEGGVVLKDSVLVLKGFVFSGISLAFSICTQLIMNVTNK